MTQLLFDVSFVQSILRVVKRISSSVSMISIVGLALALAAPVVQASTFTCASGDVQCLIIAINQANANGQPENTIQLKPGTYTLTNIDNNTDGPNGLPSITSTLTIHVAAHKTATITRASNALNFRLFHVAASGRLTLRGLTLSNGSSGVSGGGGLFNNGGVVTIANSTFISNAGLPGGGLVNNNGAVTIIGSVFDSNRAPGLFVPGSALANSGELTIVRSTFSNNVGDGAALATTNGVVRINRSRFSKNFAGHIVGGLYILGGVVLMTETTFDGNGADGAGAVYVASDSATLIVNDSAFVENIAQGSGSGAAIANLGTVQVTNTTFARNIASTLFPAKRHCNRELWDAKSDE